MKQGLAVLVTLVAVSVASTVSAQVRVVSDLDYVAGAEYPDKKDRLDVYVKELKRKEGRHASKRRRR